MEHIRRAQTPTSAIGRRAMPATVQRNAAAAPSPARTLQQRLGNRGTQTFIVHRKFDFAQSQPTLKDPIPIALSGNHTILGNTRGGVNKQVLPEIATPKAHKAIVFEAIKPVTFSYSVKQGAKTARVDPGSFQVQVFAEVSAITKPGGAKWSGTYPRSILLEPTSVCTTGGKAGSIPIDLEGNPDSATLYNKVLAHEQEHVTDLETISTKTLKAYHDFLLGLTGKGTTDEQCVDDIFRQVGRRDALAAADFIDQFLAAVQVYDRRGGTHHSKFGTHVDPQCTAMHIKEKT
jgi:hypothetical protein